jgi:hypothetical protein
MLDPPKQTNPFSAGLAIKEKLIALATNLNT